MTDILDLQDWRVTSTRHEDNEPHPPSPASRGYRMRLPHPDAGRQPALRGDHHAHTDYPRRSHRT